MAGLSESTCAEKLWLNSVERSGGWDAERTPFRPDQVRERGYKGGLRLCVSMMHVLAWLGLGMGMGRCARNYREEDAWKLEVPVTSEEELSVLMCRLGVRAVRI